MSHLSEDEKLVLEQLFDTVSTMSMEHKRNLLTGCEFLVKYLANAKDIESSCDNELDKELGV